MRIISYKELSSHNQANDCWVLTKGQVYDVTAFMDTHPGGPMKLFEFAGKEASEAFEGHSDDAIELSKDYLIGKIQPGPVPEMCKVVEKPLNSRQWILLSMAFIIFLISLAGSQLDFFKKYKLVE